MLFKSNLKFISTESILCFFLFNFIMTLFLLNRIYYATQTPVYGVNYTISLTFGQKMALKNGFSAKRKYNFPTEYLGSL